MNKGSNIIREKFELAGAIALVAGISLAAAADFKIDRSVMSGKYWEILQITNQPR